MPRLIDRGTEKSTTAMEQAEDIQGLSRLRTISFKSATVRARWNSYLMLLGLIVVYVPILVASTSYHSE
jgi:hypothetical protein